MLFVHDHKFRIFKNKIYTLGSLDNRLFNIYIKIFNDVVVYANVLKSSSIKGKEVNNVSFSLASPKSVFSPKRLSLLWNLLKKEKYFILRVPSINSSIAALFLQLVGKKYYVEVVGCVVDSLWNHGIKGKFAMPILYILTRQSIKYASYALYVTNNFLQKRYPTNGESCACSDVFIPRVEIKDSLDNPRALKKKDEVLKLGTAAADIKYKGQRYVIEAVSALTKAGFNVQYYLAGVTVDSYLYQVARKYNVADRIHCLGILKSKEMETFYNDIDVYIQPSLVEGMPRSLIEAIAMGCYCIGSKVGGIPEILGSEYCFKKKSVSEICDKILNFYTVDWCLIEKQRNMIIENFNSAVLTSKRNEFMKAYKKSVDDSV